MDSTSPRGRARPVGWLSPREAAVYAKTSRETMRALLRSGAIPCYPSLSSRMPGAVAKDNRIVAAEDIEIISSMTHVPFRTASYGTSICRSAASPLLMETEQFI